LIDKSFKLFQQYRAERGIAGINSVVARATTEFRKVLSINQKPHIIAQGKPYRPKQLQYSISASLNRTRHNFAPPHPVACNIGLES
jgi:hypothetical protein